MKPSLIEQILLYRYRYIIGYSFLAIFAVFVIFFQINLLGPGVSQMEQTSAIASSNWGWDWRNWQDASLAVVNLPYILLQKLSIALFGLSEFSIRMPSALIGLASAGLFFLIMRKLHKSNVALISSILFLTSSWFIAFTHFGTPFILVPFAWLLIIYSMIGLARVEKPQLGWAALAAFSIIFSLYVPYGIYALAVAILLSIIHPRIRQSFGAIEGPQYVLAIFVILPLVIPLGWGLYQDPSQIMSILGIPKELPSPLQYLENIWAIILALAWKSPSLPEIRLSTLPILDIGTTALAIAGLWRVIVDRHSIRSQAIIVSLLLLIIVLALQPQSFYLPLLIPIYILAAFGLSVLFNQWYNLFPRNPYARSFGLIPIIIFLALLVGFQYQKYFTAWANAPETYYAYNNDISLIRKSLKDYPNLTIVAKASDKQWYELIIAKYPKARFQTTTNNIAVDQPILASSEIARVGFREQRPLTPIVNSDKENSLRFWLAAPPK